MLLPQNQQLDPPACILSVALLLVWAVWLRTLAGCHTSAKYYGVLGKTSQVAANLALKRHRNSTLNIKRIIFQLVRVAVAGIFCCFRSFVFSISRGYTSWTILVIALTLSSFPVNSVPAMNGTATDPPLKCLFRSQK